LLERRAIGVFVGLFSVNSEQWDRICECIGSSTKAAAMLTRFPSLWRNFEEPYDLVLEKAHRLYGGLSQCLYTSHPFDFQVGASRPRPWYRALLSASDG
jgi:hypothetical protein